VFAIVLSKLGVEAQTALFKLQKLGERQLVGEEMLPFFKTSYSVYCTSSYLVLIRESLESAIEKLKEGKVNLTDQANALNLLYLYLANF